MFSRSLAAKAAIVLVVALAGCSHSEPALDGSLDAGATPDAPAGRRQIPDDVLARRAIAYSGYRTGESPQTSTYPSEEEIKEDLELLVRGGWTFLRLFDASTHAERVLKVIRDNGLDIRIMAGVWIAGAKKYYDAQNREQIEKCIALATTYQDIVAAVSVGNETLDDWSSVRVPPSELSAYIQEVRGRIVQPVTTDDMYLPFTLGQVGATSYADVLEVAEAVDFLSIHAYAFLDAPWNSWEWKVEGSPEGYTRALAMMRNAIGYTKGSLWRVHQAMAAHGLDIPILLGEAGWKTWSTSVRDATEVYRAHPVNQKMFYDGLMRWVYGSDRDAASPKAAFYFEAFDEPWKSEDDGWGLFDVDRKAKYAIWSLFPDEKPAGAPDYGEDDAVYYKREAESDAGDAGASDADAAARDASQAEADVNVEAETGPIPDAMLNAD